MWPAEIRGRSLLMQVNAGAVAAAKASDLAAGIDDDFDPWLSGVSAGRMSRLDRAEESDACMPTSGRPMSTMRMSEARRSDLPACKRHQTIS